ncbi:hypothetical protein [Amycolatopsis sp. NPDC049868]|uniref:hypothetical protein n=1 Tax=Amycolatopsis sp. NPDC049868 TaxID=3363934 RepID=UPI003793E113
MTGRLELERITAQIVDALCSVEPATPYCATATQLGRPGLGFTGDELIELVLGLERRFGVELPDEQSVRLETMTVQELTADFAALLRDPAFLRSGETRLPTRAEVLHLVAEARGVDPDEVSEEIDSFTRMWVLHAMEQRRHAHLEIPSTRLARMDSVDHAVQVLREELQRTETGQRSDTSSPGMSGKTSTQGA